MYNFDENTLSFDKELQEIVGNIISNSLGKQMEILNLYKMEAEIKNFLNKWGNDNNIIVSIKKHQYEYWRLDISFYSVKDPKHRIKNSIELYQRLTEYV